MSGEDRRVPAPQEPPWTVDSLADLHAGVLDEFTAARLRASVQGDEQAQEVLDALEATSAHLRAAPDVPMPEDVAGRLNAALHEEAGRRAAEPPAGAAPCSYAGASGRYAGSLPAPVPAGPDAEVPDLNRARGRRSTPRRATRWGAGLLTSAAAVLGILVFTTGREHSAPDSVKAVPTPDTSAAQVKAPLALSGDAPTTIPPGVFGAHQYGPLGDPQRMRGCLAANGISPTAKPLGVRQVTLNGRPATLIVLNTGGLGRFRALTVGPDCSAGNPATVSNTTVGG